MACATHRPRPTRRRHLMCRVASPRDLRTSTASSTGRMRRMRQNSRARAPRHPWLPLRRRRHWLRHRRAQRTRTSRSPRHRRARLAAPARSAEVSTCCRRMPRYRRPSRRRSWLPLRRRRHAPGASAPPQSAHSHPPLASTPPYPPRRTHSKRRTQHMLPPPASPRIRSKRRSQHVLAGGRQGCRPAPRHLTPTDTPCTYSYSSRSDFGSSPSPTHSRCASSSMSPRLLPRLLTPQASARGSPVAGRDAARVTADETSVTGAPHAQTVAPRTAAAVATPVWEQPARSCRGCVRAARQASAVRVLMLGMCLAAAVGVRLFSTASLASVRRCSPRCLGGHSRSARRLPPLPWRRAAA